MTDWPGDKQYLLASTFLSNIIHKNCQYNDTSHNHINYSNNETTIISSRAAPPRQCGGAGLWWPQPFQPALPQRCCIYPAFGPTQRHSHWVPACICYRRTGLPPEVQQSRSSSLVNIQSLPMITGRQAGREGGRERGRERGTVSGRKGGREGRSEGGNKAQCCSGFLSNIGYQDSITRHCFPDVRRISYGCYFLTA